MHLASQPQRPGTTQQEPRTSKDSLVVPEIGVADLRWHRRSIRLCSAHAPPFFQRRAAQICIFAACHRNITPIPRRRPAFVCQQFFALDLAQAFVRRKESIVLQAVRESDWFNKPIFQTPGRGLFPSGYEPNHCLSLGLSGTCGQLFCSTFRRSIVIDC